MREPQTIDYVLPPSAWVVPVWIVEATTAVATICAGGGLSLFRGCGWRWSRTKNDHRAQRKSCGRRNLYVGSRDERCGESLRQFPASGSETVKGHWKNLSNQFRDDLRGRRRLCDVRYRG